MTDTIFARATGAPPAAIAIVRVSGPAAADAAEALLGRVPPPRLAQRNKVRDPRTGALLDDALALFFSGPASATGEDVLELHLHGGRAIGASVESVLAALPGLRRAEAGEFTRRAVANGRMDLLEAESLGELLAAETELHRRVASEGGSRFRQLVERWRERLMAISADVEAAIDHDEMVDLAALQAQAAEVAAEIENLLARPSVDRLRDGFLVVIAGPPNAGKSTLFNLLLGDDAAIVSPWAGTTRDVLDRTVVLAGIPIRLVDTAGQREGLDPVEAIGIERAANFAERADLLLWMGADEPPRGVEVVRLQSRCDVDQDEPWAELHVSGLTGAGLERLLAVTVERLSHQIPPPGEALVNERQRAALFDVHAALLSCSQQDDEVLFAAETADARRSFERLSGRVGTEDLLDAIFSRFCLGK